MKARNAAMSAQGPAQVGGGEPAERRAWPADRAVGGLSRSESQHQLPAVADRTVRYREQARRGRRFFNNAVRNTTRHPAFPAALFAGAFGFQKRDFFDLGERRRSSNKPLRSSSERLRRNASGTIRMAAYGLYTHIASNKAAFDLSTGRTVPAGLCDGVLRRADCRRLHGATNLSTLSRLAPGLT